MKPEPEPVDVAAAIHELPESYLQCRDLRHAWRDYDVVHDVTRHLYEVRLRCPKCKTIRTRLIGEAGQYIGNSYDYPDGYVVKGIGRMDEDNRDLLRLVALQHMQARLAGKGTPR